MFKYAIRKLNKIILINSRYKIFLFVVCDDFKVRTLAKNFKVEFFGIVTSDDPFLLSIQHPPSHNTLIGMENKRSFISVEKKPKPIIYCQTTKLDKRQQQVISKQNNSKRGKIKLIKFNFLDKGGKHFADRLTNAQIHRNINHNK